MRGRWLSAIIFAAGLGLSGAGHAQSVPELRLNTETDSTQPALRPGKDDQDPYEPLGIDTGGLTLFPSLEITGTVSSNVTQQKASGEAGAGIELKPALRFESDWVRHSWTGEASADMLRYLDHGEMSATTAQAGTDFRLDIRRHTYADFSASYALDTSNDFDTGVPGSEIGDGTEQDFTGSAGLTHDFGPLETQVRLGTSRSIFGDVRLSGGGTQDNGDRDYTEPSIALRATYKEPPVFRPFVEAAYNPRIHDRAIDRNGERRDSDGYALKAGIALNDDPIWTGDIAVTYLRRSYEDAALADNDAVGLAGSLTWSPTELTELSLSLGTELTEATDAGFSRGRKWTAGLDLTQSLRDNLDFIAGAGVEFEDTVDGTDVTYDGSLGLLWKLNRNFSITTGYSFEWLDAAVPADGYMEHRVSAGIVVQR